MAEPAYADLQNVMQNIVDSEFQGNLVSFATQQRDFISKTLNQRSEDISHAYNVSISPYEFYREYQYTARYSKIEYVITVENQNIDNNVHSWDCYIPFYYTPWQTVMSEFSLCDAPIKKLVIENAPAITTYFHNPTNWFYDRPPYEGDE